MSRPWQQVPCIRLSPTGQVQVDYRYPNSNNGLAASEVEVWLEVNHRRHPECALIVSDEVKEFGEFPDLEAVATACENLRIRIKGHL